MFAQSLIGEVKKWYRELLARSIVDLPQFHQIFLTRWEAKKNPLQILNEYKNLKRAPNEIVEDYCARFNYVYNSIPAAIKPPPGLSLIHFPEGFDVDMAYMLRERDPNTLEEMQSDDFKVEANLIGKRAKLKIERRVAFKEEPYSSSLDSKLDNLIKTMEKMMERITMVDRTPPREPQGGPQI